MRERTRLLGNELGRPQPFRSLTAPVHRASTVVFDTTDDFLRRRDRLYDGFTYGLYGTPTTRILEERIAELEGAPGAIAVPSGLAAIALVNLACLGAGDHVLVPDSAYPPAKAQARQVLARLGVTMDVYDPLAGSAIRDMLKPVTRLVWVESPGSSTLEVQDVPAIVAAAKSRGIMVAADNTWATPLLFKPLAHGVDIVVEAATKYIAGHSDVTMGIMAAADVAMLRRLKDVACALGIGVSPDDCYLAIRGLATMEVRLRHQGAVTRMLAERLANHSLVQRVLHPALPGHPGHDVWKRDFKAASGVFTIVLPPAPMTALSAFVDGMRVFRIGASWGGVNSLLAPFDALAGRSFTAGLSAGHYVRLGIGLEDPEDLLADLEAGLDRFRQACRSAARAGNSPNGVPASGEGSAPRRGEAE